MALPLDNVTDGIRHEVGQTNKQRNRHETPNIYCGHHRRNFVTYSFKVTSRDAGKSQKIKVPRNDGSPALDRSQPTRRR